MSDRLIILGAGESGTGAALLAQAKGLPVFISDAGIIAEHYRRALEKAGIPFEEGGHSDDLWESAYEVVKSPGIPENTAVVQGFVDRGIPVISELEFASRYTKAKLIAITGTNGKTTTTLLTYHLLQQAGLRVGLAGNVGQSLAALVIEDNYDYYVVEVSSFQLDGMFHFKADIAVLLNITKDHLDRYQQDFKQYVASKFRIKQNMTGDDSFIYFADDEVISTELRRQQLEAAKFAVSLVRHQDPGAFAEGDKLHFNISTPPDGPYEIALDEIPMHGPHNMVNAMAACLAALLCDVPLDKLIEGLNTFKNAAHRLEYVGELLGAVYINDSKATNVDSVFYALQSFDKPIVWIAGGVDKGNDYSLIEDLVSARVKALVCMGVDNQPLIDAFEEIVPQYFQVDSMEAAIDAAMKVAGYGDVVLLSPACASFDLFKNYQDRGEQFKNIVEDKKKVRSVKVLVQ